MEGRETVMGQDLVENMGLPRAPQVLEHTLTIDKFPWASEPDSDVS